MQRIWKFLNMFEEIAMIVGGLAMVLLNFIDVVCRYLLPQTPFSYASEMIVLLFVWTSMFGISYGYRKGAHTVLTVISDNLGGKAQAVLVVLSTLASVFLMLMIAYTGYGMAMNQVRFNQILPGMRIPAVVVGGAIPVGSLFCTISVLQYGYLEVKKIISCLSKGGKTA